MGRRPTIIAIGAASIALSGCAALLEVGLLEEAGIGLARVATVGEVGVAVEVGAAEVTVARVGLSADLVESAATRLASGTRQGSLSNAFVNLTEGGRIRAQLGLDAQGRVWAKGRPLAAVASSGEIVAAGRTVGRISPADGQLYEYLKDGSTRPIAKLEGFIPENGVELRSTVDGTVVRVLRSDVVLDVVSVADGRYVIRLADGQLVWAPESAIANLALLSIDQQSSDCPSDDRAGAVVRFSGELIRFEHCRDRPGALLLKTANGEIIVDRYDVKVVLTGDGIPGVDPGHATERLVNKAQVAASAVNQTPGDAAMTTLATTEPLPTLENADFMYPPRYARGPGPEVWRARAERYAERQRLAAAPPIIAGDRAWRRQTDARDWRRPDMTMSNRGDRADRWDDRARRFNRGDRFRRRDRLADDRRFEESRRLQRGSEREGGYDPYPRPRRAGAPPYTDRPERERFSPGSRGRWDGGPAGRRWEPNADRSRYDMRVDRYRGERVAPRLGRPPRRERDGGARRY